MARRKCELSLWLACCLLGASGGVVPAPLYAETRTAADLTPEAVGKAIDAAKDGDIVQLPAGTAVWSKKGWHTGHSPKVKAITIQGAGIDKTIITVDKSKSGNYVFRVGGRGRQAVPRHGHHPRRIITPRRSELGRADEHQRHLQELPHRSLQVQEFRCDAHDQRRGDRGTYGLVDHCYFDGQLSHGGCLQPICYSGPGAANYRKPLTLGTAQAMYFEDNEVNLRGAVATGDNPFIVAINAARVVIRHNKIVNAEIEIYGPGQRKYGCQTAEIYDNQFATVDGGRPGASSSSPPARPSSSTTPSPARPTTAASSN